MDGTEASRLTGEYDVGSGESHQGPVGHPSNFAFALRWEAIESFE